MLKKAALALCVITAVASAQTTFVVGGAAFVDISPAGNALGLPIPAVGDDTIHNIVTVIGNNMFPAGNVRVGNNGFALAGNTTATVSLGNATIPASGLPVGVTAGAPAATGYIFPYWDDLDPVPEPSAVTLYWWEDLANNILYIQWNNDGHFSGVAGQLITFQAQIIGGVNADCNGTGPSIRYAYADTVFGGTQAALDNGASATVGYAKGAGASANGLFSFNTASLAGVLSLDVFGSVAGNTISMAISSPGGPGDLQIDFGNGPCVGGQYFLAVTTAAGAFPAGWFYGLDIPLAQLAGQFTTGFPFVGPMIPNLLGSSFTLGPFGAGALPSGLQFWAVATLLPAGGNGSPTAASTAQTYIIP